MTSIESRVRGAQEIANVTVVAESPDGMVEATVGAFGDLRGLWMDPRHQRTRDSAALEATLLSTVRAAGKSAARVAYQAVASQLPPGSTYEEADLLFDPALWALETIPAWSTGGTGSRPTIGTGLDRVLWRRRLLTLQQRVRVTTASVDSDDGLITVTVGGPGELLDVRLDARIYRVADARRLAAEITNTARAAVDSVRGQIRADLQDILTERGSQL
jgi:DNA-binding protein YbaB